MEPMLKNIAAKDEPAARLIADEYEHATGLKLTYKETIGSVPGAIFVYLCEKRSR